MKRALLSEQDVSRKAILACYSQRKGRSHTAHTDPKHVYTEAP